MPPYPNSWLTQTAVSPFTYRHDQLLCEDMPLADLITQFGTPLFVYSQADLLRRAKIYQTAVSRPDQTLICYATKANANPALLKLLQKAGLGADVTSGGELFLSQHAGFDPQTIIFSGVGKRRDEIEMALEGNIRALHVESAMELEQIAAVAQARQQVANIGVRVNPDIRPETHPYISTGQHSSKFGVPRETAVSLLKKAAAHDWLNPVGLAAHIGSQIVDIPPFVEAAQYLCQLADELKRDGITLDYIDVGGGLGIDYAKPTAPPLADWVTAVSDPVFAAGYQLVMEPGRSIVGAAGALLVSVVYTKQQKEKQFVIVDGGMNDLLRPTLYKAYHPILPLKRKVTDERLIAVDVVGPICESSDFLAQERPLPPLQPGDALAVMQAGAYGFAMSSNYNGRLRAAELLVSGDTAQLIRQRQQYSHLLDGCA